MPRCTKNTQACTRTGSSIVFLVSARRVLVRETWRCDRWCPWLLLIVLARRGCMCMCMRLYAYCMMTMMMSVLACARPKLATKTPVRTQITNTHTHTHTRTHTHKRWQSVIEIHREYDTNSQTRTYKTPVRAKIEFSIHDIIPSLGYFVECVCLSADFVSCQHGAAAQQHGACIFHCGFQGVCYHCDRWRPRLL